MLYVIDKIHKPLLVKKSIVFKADLSYNVERLANAGLFNCT